MFDEDEVMELVEESMDTVLANAHPHDKEVLGDAFFEVCSYLKNRLKEMTPPMDTGWLKKGYEEYKRSFREKNLQLNQSLCCEAERLCSDKEDCRTCGRKVTRTEGDLAHIEDKKYFE